jgi:hypothetical protein
MEEFKSYYQNYRLKYYEYMNNIPSGNDEGVIDNSNPYKSYNTGEEYINTKLIAIEEFLKLVDNDSINYESYLDYEFRQAATEKDDAKLDFLFNLVQIRLPDYLADTLSFVIGKLLIYYESSGLEKNKYSVYIEKALELISFFPEPDLITLLEKVCKKGMNYIMSSYINPVVKAIDALYAIETKDAFQVIKDCLNHPNKHIVFEAKETIGFLKEDGLVDTSGNWIGK